MRILSIFTLLFFSLIATAQVSLKGEVREENGQAIFAANVYPKSNPEKGVTSDFEGTFSLPYVALADTLVVSFIGFDPQLLVVADIDTSQRLVITLRQAAASLATIVVKGADPIAEQFSVVKLTKMDIYLNPVAQGDPLKAITLLPASTTSDESANPSLRGSDADRSRVVLNNVPIYNPVRSSQLNNQGFFSLFNPEMIDQLYVYASNPPLSYGNTSAGLVDIQTNQKLEQNQVQLSTSLANVGVLFSQSFKKETSFIQAYGNIQFSAAFIDLNRSNIPRLKSFRTKDFGLNFHHKIGEKIVLNSFHYGISEGFDFKTARLAFEGNSKAQKTRYFTVNNLKINTLKGIININSGFNTSNSIFSMGNLNSDNDTRQLFHSVDYKYLGKKDDAIQVGISHDFHTNRFDNRTPTFYYAMDENDPSFSSIINNTHHNLEGYAYGRFSPSPDWTLSAGLRSNLPIRQQTAYLSAQAALKHQLAPNQSLLLSGGRYHSYTTPNFFQAEFQLLGSKQIALDYSLKAERASLQAALYYKLENGETHPNVLFERQQVETSGIEVFWEQDWGKHFTFSLANSFINQQIEVGSEKFSGNWDYNYFLKSSLQYQHPRLFVVALSYLNRPGSPYTPIAGANFQATINKYEPIFSTSWNSARFGGYQRFDLNLSRYFQFEKYALVTFATVTNLFNQKNQREVLYSPNYEDYNFDYYQQRSIYIGLVWQWDY